MARTAGTPKSDAMVIGKKPNPGFIGAKRLKSMRHTSPETVFAAIFAFRSFFEKIKNTEKSIARNIGSNPISVPSFPYDFIQKEKIL